MFHRFTPFTAAFVVSLASFVSVPAHAQSSSSSSGLARVLFREARKLMDKGRFDEACPKLEESLRLDDGMGTQFNLAHCWEKIGRTASAWGLFLDVASAAHASGQKKREAAARQRARVLEPELARLMIEVPHPVPGLVVVREGDELGPATWGTAIPVDPGVHRVQASAPGRLPWFELVTLDATSKAVSVVVPELEPEHVEPPPEPPIVAPQPSIENEPDVGKDSGGISSARIVVSTVLAAVGVGGVVIGTIYGLKANSETKAARALCVGGLTGNVCERDRLEPGFDFGQREFDEREAHRESSDRAALVGYVAGGIGAAALISSTIVLVTGSGADDDSDRKADAARFQIEPILGSGELGASLRTRF